MIFKKKKIFFLFIVLIFGLNLFGENSNSKIVKKWDNLKFGNHRAVVFIDKKSEAVYAKIVWRRRDKSPSDKKIIIIDSKTGKSIENFVRIYINNFKGEFVFKPVSAPSYYYIYYLPYRYNGSKNYPKTEYLKLKTHKINEWILKYSNLSKKELMRLPIAKFIKLESVNEFNEFTKLEKTATLKEIEKQINNYKDRDYLLFPETKENIIRMFHKIPYNWTKKILKNKIDLKGLKGEFLSFQIGVFPYKKDLQNVKIEFSDLIGKKRKIKSEKINCFNAGGIDFKGEKFSKRLDFKKGTVYPLWFGIDIDYDKPAGFYSGFVKIIPENGKPQTVKINLIIEDKKIKAHGDNNPFGLSRLRWLNSRLGDDNIPVKPYIPLKLKNNTISILGRDIILQKNGLPSAIKTYFKDTLTKIGKEGKDILKSPILFKIIDSFGKTISIKLSDIKFTLIEKGRIGWELSGENKAFKMKIRGFLDYDGYMDYKIDIKGKKNIEINDIYLQVPFGKEFAKYMMGLGFKGGKRAKSYNWHWDKEKNQDSVWIGNVNGGIQIAVRGINYSRPLNTNFYHLKPLNMPNSWYNSGKGGFNLKEKNKTVFAKFYSGKRIIKKGEKLGFYFSFLITPFKTINTKEHWKNRYFHSFKPIEEIKKTGANIINVHHATEINPFINYPFLRADMMKKYIEKAHKEGMKVKIYYTVRELSNHAPEIFALKSFGDEIFSPGNGGGPSWLIEHFGDNYIAGWYVPKYEDAAIITNGSSRWHNHYVEGLNWLVKNVGIDGIYIDDIAFDRNIMRRIKRVFEMNGKDAIIDVHSANQYNPRDGYASSANLYLEHFPYINRLWFGEYFNYDSKPDYWLVEISGIPFGLMGEMLQGGGNPYRGMIYGMTARLPWAGDPRPLWKLWDEFGIEDSEMIGYWSKECPVKTDNKDILTTVYKKDDKALIAIASWAKQSAFIKLKIDWKKLGIDKEKAIIKVPFVKDFQDYENYNIKESIKIAPKKGLLLIIKNNGS